MGLRGLFIGKTTRLGPGSAQSGANSTYLALGEGLEGDASKNCKRKNQNFHFFNIHFF